MRIAPADTRCAAENKRAKDGRCKNQIYYDEESDTWMRWCENHYRKIKGK